MVSVFEAIKRKLFLMKVNRNLRPMVKHAWKGGSVEDIASKTDLIDMKILSSPKKLKKFDQSIDKMFDGLK